MKESTKAVIDNLIERYPDLINTLDDINNALDILINCYKNGGKLLVCGNGGSAADAEHITGELMKSFKLKRRLPEHLKEVLGDYIYNHLEGALPCISLVSQTALTTAYANDQAPDLSFAQQVYGYGRENDVFLGISTSGNSKNVIYAAEVAKALGLKVIGLTKHGSNKLREISDVCIGVEKDETFEIQELHLPVYHALCAALEVEFF